MTMIFFILLIITFIVDYITLNNSQNHKDKKIYIISMLIIGILGVVFLKYKDDIQIAPKVLELVNFYGGK